MLLPLTTTLAGETSTEISKTNAYLRMAYQVKASAHKIYDSKGEELIYLRLINIDTDIRRQCGGKYYLDMLESSANSPLEHKFASGKFNRLVGLQVELSSMKTIQRESGGVFCLFGGIKIIPHPKNKPFLSR